MSSRTAVALLVVAALAAPLSAASGGPSAGDSGTAVDGRDRARILPPHGARVADYENAGYRLVRQGDEVVVEVDAIPLESHVRFVLPAGAAAGDRIARLARGLASGARTQYDAATRILGWIARHVEYSADRSASQRAEDVLDRRRGYCTGVARLTVALLRAVDLEAREVAGWVIDDPVAGTGYHRWVEVHFEDRGWVFSDPLSSHHFVPATYVRLASDELLLDDGLEGLLLERDDRLASVDLFPSAVPGIRARRNVPRRLAAAVRVEVDFASGGLAMLIGDTALHRKALVDGETTFVGLEPGRYRLRLFLPGRDVIERLLNLPDRRHRAVRWTADGEPADQRTGRWPEASHPVTAPAGRP